MKIKSFSDMKPNRLAYSFLCLFLIFGLQGCGQKKSASSPEKASGIATNGVATKPWELYKVKTNEVENDIVTIKADALKGDAKAQYKLAVFTLMAKECRRITRKR